MNNAARIVQIRQRLESALAPTTLTIIDESHLHVGHVGAQQGAGHFAITIQSEQFIGQPLLHCHRLIYAALDDLMQHDIHALKIKILR